MGFEDVGYRIHHASGDRAPGIKENIAHNLCYVRLRYIRGLSHDEAIEGCKHHLERK